MSFRNHIDIRVRTVSRSTSAKLSVYSKYIGNRTLVDIKQHFGLEYSIATLYTAFSLMKIPVDPMKLSEYQCPSCKILLTVLFPFYGSPHRLRCPICSIGLKRKWINSIPFYSHVEGDYFFNGYQLVSVSASEFNTMVKPLIGIWKKSFPSFQADEKDVYHIIQSYQNWKPQSFCGVPGKVYSTARIVSGLTSKIPIETVCPTCMQEVLSRIKSGETLVPVCKDKKLSKRAMAIKLFLDAKYLGSINSACANNNKSRRSYYRMKKQYLSEYNTIFGEKS